MQQALECRRSTPRDVDVVTAIITAAFATDPLWGWAMAREDGSTHHLASMWRLSIEGALRYPWTWLANEGEATSVWIPPGGTEMSAEQEVELEALAREVLGAHATRYLDVVDRFAAAHPHSEPHYYLSLLATHPDHRGKGVGVALLAHDLAMIDAEGMPAYLESTNPANDQRYARLGFTKVGEFPGADGGPAVSTMWREPR